jgi:DNA-directed RNA polymerase subunit RPC12/RpoP
MLALPAYPRRIIVTEVIAGKVLISCPKCSAPVREDLLSGHESRCQAKAIESKVGQSSTYVETKQNNNDEEVDQSSTYVEPKRNNNDEKVGQSSTYVETKRNNNDKKVGQSSTYVETNRNNNDKKVGQSSTYVETNRNNNDEKVGQSSTYVETKRNNNDEEDELVECPQCLRLFHKAFLNHHLQRCTGLRRPVEQIQTKEQKVRPHPKSKKTRSYTGSKLRRTADGYLIDTCHRCGRRICLVPKKSDRDVDMFDIEMGRKSRTPHLCDDSKPDFRRTQLLYVDLRPITE